MKSSFVKSLHCSIVASVFADLLLCAFALSASAQSSLSNAPAPFDQAAQQQNALTPFKAALNLLPAWDPNATYTFGAKEFTLESAPLWKTMTASGTTPYNSTEGDYFFNRNFALGGEIISFGDGTGNNMVDTIHANLTLRKDVGNIAGYLLMGGGYDLNRSRPDFAFGPGIIYGYQTRIRLFVDTRGQLEGTKSGKIGFLTRAGIQLYF